MSTEFRDKYLVKFIESEDFERDVLCCRMLMDIYNITEGKGFFIAVPGRDCTPEEKKNVHENLQKIVKVFEDAKKFFHYFDDFPGFFIPDDKMPIVREQNLDIKNRVLKKFFLNELEVVDEKEKWKKQRGLETSLDLTRRTVVAMLSRTERILKAENSNTEFIIAFEIDRCFEEYDRLVSPEMREILVQDFGRRDGKPEEKPLDRDKK